MSRTYHSYSDVDRGIVIGTVFLLLLLPLLAAQQETWPSLVGLSFSATIGVCVLWKRDPLTMSQVLWGALLLRLVFLPLLPGLTDDLYRYIWDGWLQVEGLNPYQYAPENQALSRFQSSPVYERMNSQSYFSIYPPLAQLFFAVGGWFQSIDWTVSYFVLKGLFAAVEFGGVLVLSRLTSKRNLLLYAWNPLILIETAGQGHTEGLLVFCLVGLVWAVQRGWGRVASVAVAGAGLVKIYPFVLWPFLIRRFGWSAVWPGVALGIGVSLPYAAPYTLPHIKASVDLFSQLFEFNAGFYFLVKFLADVFTGQDWSKVIGPAFRYIFLTTLPVLYYLDWRQKWSFVRSALVTIGLFLILSTTVHPWYFLPVLALGVLSERPAWPWFWIAGLSIGTYQFYIDGSYWLWVVLGWGGGAALALWMYRTQVRALISRAGFVADIIRRRLASQSAS